ncbi:MAG: Undecaprenyl diphosphate synthase [Ktedonobacterales bacterium]|jgi:undecaprenyl diphosphate synthase|nr:MAG: Undecaprenyl diphosphate synthase [Ktedonobacterales bacterium]
MAKSYFRNLLTAVGVALDGGARQREAERQSELARLTIRDGRAIPQHIAIIMDGNGRWATQRHLPRAVGHPAGVEALRRVVQLANDYSVPMLTVYAFSTENWGRPQEEVDALMRLMWETIRTDVDRLNREGVRLRHIGRLEGLAQDVRDAIAWMQDLTRDNDKLTLNVCFNYGGRVEIVDAVRAIVAAGIPTEQVTEELIERHLYTHGLPDPDLVIRTAGEMRLSNYLIWQAAYAEYYSTPTLWPDFDRDDFVAALDAFAQRKRKFGKLDTQVAPATPQPVAASTLARPLAEGAR